MPPKKKDPPSKSISAKVPRKRRSESILNDPEAGAGAGAKVQVPSLQQPPPTPRIKLSQPRAPGSAVPGRLRSNKSYLLGQRQGSQTPTRLRLNMKPSVADSSQTCSMGLIPQLPSQIDSRSPPPPYPSDTSSSITQQSFRSMRPSGSMDQLIT